MTNISIRPVDIIINTGSLPPNLQQLIDQVSAGAIGYSDRGDAQQLADWIAKGDHGMAEFKARQIIERQKQFRHAQQHGLPAALQELIDQVSAGAIGYSDRGDDAQQLADYIAKGDHGMAEFKAKQIIERQDNIRSCTDKIDT